jgi:hypothetical protein
MRVKWNKIKMYAKVCTSNNRNRGENLMDADGNKGAVPGRSCNKACVCAFVLFSI